jgi:hypothetical protein
LPWFCNDQTDFARKNLGKWTHELFDGNNRHQIKVRCKHSQLSRQPNESVYVALNLESVKLPVGENNIGAPERICDGQFRHNDRVMSALWQRQQIVDERRLNV